MKNTLTMLLRLNEIDTAINEIEESRALIPTAVRELEKKIQVLESELKSALTRKAELEAARHDAETAIREKKEWIASREGMVKDIKTNKEYHAALKEVAVAKKEISDRETQVVQLSGQITDLESQLTGLQSSTTPQIETLRAQIEEHKLTYDSSTPSLEEKQKARGAITVEIEAKSLAIYDQVRTRLTPVLAKAVNTTCTECGSRIQPQLFNRLFSTTELLTCPRCRRILYVEEVLNKA